MRAALQSEIGQDKLEVVDDMEAVGPGPGKVKIRVKATGLCHSDLSAMSGCCRSRPPSSPATRAPG